MIQASFPQAKVAKCIPYAELIIAVKDQYHHSEDLKTKLSTFICTKIISGKPINNGVYQYSNDIQEKIIDFKPDPNKRIRNYIDDDIDDHSKKFALTR